MEASMSLLRKGELTSGDMPLIAGLKILDFFMSAPMRSPARELLCGPEAEGMANVGSGAVLVGGALQLFCRACCMSMTC